MEEQFSAIDILHYKTQPILGLEWILQCLQVYRKQHEYDSALWFSFGILYILSHALTTIFKYCFVRNKCPPTSNKCPLNFLHPKSLWLSVPGWRRNKQINKSTILDQICSNFPAKTLIFLPNIHIKCNAEAIFILTKILHIFYSKFTRNKHPFLKNCTPLWPLL